MNRFMCLAFQVTLKICALLFCCFGATSIRLSPLGMVSVCPGGQVLLTCERISGSVLYWDVSVPHMAAITQRIVLSQGDLLLPEFRIGFTEFHVTRTSSSPLISQLLINNVTTEINGSTICCSEDGDENNAPITVTVINVKNKDEFLRSMDHSLNVTMVNQLLRSDDVTVTLQWPREPGAVYHVSVSSEVSHTEHISMGHYVFAINLIISYNIQYNVSIVSSLCGVTTTKALKYVTCDYQGQFITYTCPPGFILTGPNASVCTGNREWEPDPGQVDCIADHGCRVPMVNRYVKLNFSFTLEGSVLILTCENEKLMSTTNATDQQVLKVICHSTATNWNPDPTDFIESCSLSYLTTSIAHSETSPRTPVVNIMVLIIVTLIAVCVVSSIVFLSIGYACGWFSQKHKQSRTRKAASDSPVEENTGPNEGSQLPPTPGPLYEELLRSTPEHQDLVELKENVAYGPIVK